MNRRQFLTRTVAVGAALSLPAGADSMNGVLKIGLALALTLTTAPWAWSYDRSHPLDAEIEHIIDQWGLPGLAVAVVKDDAVVFARGYGVREAGTDGAVDEHTIFGIGSTTKSFATATTAMVVDAGKARWDDHAIDHLPWFRLYDPWTTHHTTIRDLTSHRMGVDSTFVWAARTWDRGTVLRRMQHLKPTTEFRTGFVYSNMGMMLLGEIVEAHSRNTWARFLKERIFKPLGMNRSFAVDHEYVQKKHMAPCWICEPPEGAIVGKKALKPAYKNAATPHAVQAGDSALPVPWRYDQSGPAGSIASTAMDMAQWLRLHLNRGEYEGKRIISEAQMWQMHRPQNPIPSTPPMADNPATALSEDINNVSYGMGWMVQHYRNHRQLWHNGGQVGGGATMAVLPDDNLGVVVLQNSNWREKQVFEIVLRMLVDHYLGLEPLDWNRRYTAVDKLRVAATAVQMQGLEAVLKHAPPPSLPLAAFVGEYESEMLGPFSISEVAEAADTLVATFDQYARGTMRHMGQNRFLISFNDPMMWKIGIRFQPELDGTVKGGILGGVGGISGEYEFGRAP